MRWGVPKLRRCKFQHVGNGRRQNSLSVFTNLSQRVTELRKRISHPVGDLSRCLTKLTGPSAYPIHSFLITPTNGTNGLCDLSHTFHRQITNVSPDCFCHPIVVNIDVFPNFAPDIGISQLFVVRFSSGFQHTD